MIHQISVHPFLLPGLLLPGWIELKSFRKPQILSFFVKRNDCDGRTIDLLKYR